MQTFLPYPDFIESAKCLDYRRLGKQRVEAEQIFRIIVVGKSSGGWVNHPATKMWRGHDLALALYRDEMIKEWIRRGYKNTMPMALDYTIENVVDEAKSNIPSWFGDESFHASHRSNLLRKDPIFYGKYGWTEPADLPYIWPVKG
jgi:hypothetical protein